MHSNDAELISGFLAGETAAVERVDGWLRRAAQPFRRRLASRWDDVLQDLRLEVTRLFQAEQFGGRSTLKTYLYSVVANKCLNQIRTHGKWQWTDLEEVDRGTGENGNSRRESKDLLLRVLEEMTEECRRLWSMILDGLSYSEMEERLGVSQGALRVRVLRCRKKALEVRERLSRREKALRGEKKKVDRNAVRGFAPNTGEGER